MHRIIPFSWALVLAFTATGAGSAQAQGIRGTASPDVGIGGTDSITPAIFTNARPPVTATIKADSLDLNYLKRLDYIPFNSVPGYDPRPQYYGPYTGACSQFELELFENPIPAGSASTSFEMQGTAIPWIDDGICAVRIYDRPMARTC